MVLEDAVTISELSVNYHIFKRSKIIENEYRDPYSYFIKKDLKQKNIKFIEYEFPYKG